MTAAAETAEPVRATSRVRSLLAYPAAFATAILIVAGSVMPFFTTVWIFPAQARAEADGWTGWPIETVHLVTYDVLMDLVVGPPDFDQAIDGEVVFDEAERSHLRDVRTAMLVFAGVALAALALLILTTLAGRGVHAVRRGIRAGGIGIAAAVIAAGAFAIIAFDSAFNIFHQLLFPAGTYTFDPLNDRIVQLFPMEFWFETAIAVGVVITIVALLVAWLAGRGMPAQDRPVTRRP
jgi:integral membrane protein (TIGR01906 family)